MSRGLTPRENRRAWLCAVAIVLGLFACGGLAVLLTGGTLAGAERVYQPEEGQLVQEAAEALDAITVDAAFDPDSRLLTATQVMTLQNPSGQTLDSLMLRSYSGAFLTEETSPVATDELFAACYGTAFSPGGLEVESVQLNGQDAAFTWQDTAHTVLVLPVQWAPRETLRVTLRYRVLIPPCASRFGVSEGIYTLGNVFPTPALWQDGAWRDDPYVSIGDPFLSACANWTVRITVPRGYTVASTGYAGPAISGGTAAYTFTARAVRDFALVLSDSLVSASGMAGDVLVVAYAKKQASAQNMLAFAKAALQCYEQHYGPYAYPTLTLAEVSFPFGGMEYPRMVMISSQLMTGDTTNLELTVSHEVAHQWWYAMVGSDSFHQSWQDESLCQYAVLDYFEAAYGPDTKEDLAFLMIETAMRITVPRGVTPGSPIDYFQDMNEYSTVVYYRGAALWRALETHLGKEKLDGALRRYAEEYRFGFATRDDLTRILSDAAGHDLSALVSDYLDTYLSN